jgi:hypothetical protein
VCSDLAPIAAYLLQHCPAQSYLIASQNTSSKDEL